MYRKVYVYTLILNLPCVFHLIKVNVYFILTEFKMLEVSLT